MSKASPVQAILGLSPDTAQGLFAKLSDRERQVADLIASGIDSRRQAAQLSISTKTLDIHRANVKRKLGAKGSVDVARVIYAMKFGEHVR